MVASDTDFVCAFGNIGKLHKIEQRGEQSISLSMSRIAEEITSAVTNRVKDGQIKRDGKERTHGHK